MLVPLFGIAGLAVSVVLGAAGHVLVQLPSLARIGARILPRLELGDPEARKALVLMAPRALGLGATQVVFLVLTGLASTLAEGSIAVFNFAFAVLQIPIGVIGVPLGVVLLPSLSREAATGGMEAFRRLLVRGLVDAGPRDGRDRRARDRRRRGRDPPPVRLRIDRRHGARARPRRPSPCSCSG